MNINNIKSYKDALKNTFKLTYKHFERHELPNATRCDSHFTFSCPEHPWLDVEVDVSIYHDTETYEFLNCRINYICVAHNHPEYGRSTIAEKWDFETYDCRYDMDDAIMRELVQAYGIISTFRF